MIEKKNKKKNSIIILYINFSKSKLAIGEVHVLCKSPIGGRKFL